MTNTYKIVVDIPDTHKSLLQKKKKRLPFTMTVLQIFRTAYF